MTATGDHGGDTDDETNALLFAYSKQHKFYTSSDSGSDSEILQQVNEIRQGFFFNYLSTSHHSDKLTDGVMFCRLILYPH